MKRISLMLIAIVCYFTIQAQEVYVDSSFGDDKNPGTEESPVFSIGKAAEIIRSCQNEICIMKINPGIYVLDHHVSVATKKELADKRIVIEASILPDDASWSPEKMPVITSKALKGEIEYDHWVVSFLIDESHVTIRGLKFHGYFYPQTRYFPIARIDKTKTDLLVEQCMFVGDANISQLQVGVIAHGSKVMVDHCVFYRVRNAVVFFQSYEGEKKHGNGITNSIIFGANQANWTVDPDRDFKFENNLISNCRYVWVKNDKNPTRYSIDNCIIVNNKYFQGIPDTVRLKPGKFKIDENGVVREGEIALRMIDRDDSPTLVSVDEPLPIDYMHSIPGSLGYKLGAGLFKVGKY